METRTIEQVKLYMLHLNSIFANYENSSMVAVSADENDLSDWYESQKIEPERIDGMFYNFREGSLRNYNPIEYADHCGIVGIWTTKNEFLDYYVDCQNSCGFKTIPEIIGDKSVLLDTED